MGVQPRIIVLNKRIYLRASREAHLIDRQRQRIAGHAPGRAAYLFYIYMKKQTDCECLSRTEGYVVIAVYIRCYRFYIDMSSYGIL